MDVWYDMLLRELAEASRLSDLLAQADEEAEAEEPPVEPEAADREA